MGRFRASWLLTKQSFALLWADKEMLLFPLLSGVASLLFAGLMVVVLVLGFDLIERLDAQELTVLDYLLAFVAYASSAFFVTFSGVGVATIAAGRVSGHDLTFGDGFSAALNRAGTIFTWSLISATVGIILKYIQRQKLLGRILAAVLGAAWNLMTYFVVPVIALEQRSAWGSTRRSVEVFKAMWGEVLITNFGIGLFFVLVYVLELSALFGLAVLLFSSGIPGIVTVVLFAAFALAVLFLTALVANTLDAILKVALYLYARDGVVPSAFTPELIEGMVRRDPNYAAQRAPSTPHSSGVLS
jgi:hypothetical protein